MATADTNTLDTDRNKEAVLRFMRLMDSHDFGSLDEVLAPDLQLQLGAGKFDRHQTEDLIRMVYVAFPDFRHVVQETLAVGDRVVLRTMN